MFEPGQGDQPSSDKKKQRRKVIQMQNPLERKLKKKPAHTPTRVHFWLFSILRNVGSFYLTAKKSRKLKDLKKTVNFELKNSNSEYSETLNDAELKLHYQFDNIQTGPPWWIFCRSSIISPLPFKNIHYIGPPAGFRVQSRCIKNSLQKTLKIPSNKWIKIWLILQKT